MKIKTENFTEILESLTSHKVEFKDDVKKEDIYKESYRKLLEKKYH